MDNNSDNIKKASVLSHTLVFLVRLSNTILFLFLFSMVSILIILGLFDRFVSSNFFTSQVFNNVIENDLALSIFKPAIWLSRFNLDNLIFFFIICSLIIVIKTMFKRRIYKKIERISKKIIASIINLITNAMLMITISFLFLNIIIASYVNNIFEKISYENTAYNYRDKVKLVKGHLKKVNHAATSNLEKLMNTTNSKKISSLSDNEYIALSKKISKLIDQKGGVSTSKEHYYRNNFDRAPKYLDDMIVTILTKNDTFKWKLISPANTMLHMNGKDGEYNLKFVSENGYFEAVYNIKGILLNKKNNPLNMGTFNYANPITSPEKHSMYDVLPYLVWNNEKKLGEVRVIDEEKYENNKKAKERYLYYKRILNK